MTSSTALSRSPRSVRLAAVAGVTGPTLFTIGFLAQEAVRRAEFSPVAEPVSALEAGPGGWVQQVNFVVFAGFLATFAIGLHRGLRPVRLGWLGPALFGAASVGLVLAAVFPLRQNAAGVTYDPGYHFMSGVTFFLCSALGLLAVSYRLRRDPRFGGIATYATVAGLVGLGCFVLLGRFAIPDGAPLHDVAGLLQRLTILLVTFPCLVTIAARLGRTSR